MLEEAVRNGVVHITIDVPVDYDLDLGEQIVAKYGIRSAVAARVMDEDSENAVAVMGAAAGEILQSLVGPDDMLGISWGHTMSRVVESVSKKTGVDIVQIAGGINSDSSEISGVELAHRLATRVGGRAFPLLAPLLVGSAEMASQLRNDPSLRATTSRFDNLTVALMGIGSWNPPQSMVYNEATPDERQGLRELGAAADICGIVFDSNGHEIDSILQDRRIGITSAQLSAVPTKIAVAGGALKAAAVAAALRTGKIDVLVTDTSAAKEILALG